MFIKDATRWYLRRTLPALVAVGVTAVLLLWIARTLPLGQTEHWIYRLTIGPQHLFTLADNETLSQSFSAPADAATAIILFSPDQHADVRNLTLKIFDKHNELVAQSFGTKTSYYTEKAKISFLLHAPLHRGQKYRLELSNGGAPLLLLAIENEAYPQGEFTINNTPVQERDVALALASPIPLPTSAKFGVVAGVIYLLGALLITVLPAPARHYRWLAASLLCSFITPLALGGLWFSQPNWGISDWDYYFSLHHVWRETIVTHHQFPLWNPYTCGGTAALSDPEFSVVTPSFLLFELPFGIPVGLRLAALFSVAVGSVGMLQLARRLGLSVQAALLVALAATFSSVNILEIVEGHPNIFAAMWIPWIFWSWLGAYRTQQKPLWCGLFLALTFLQGGIYLLLYVLLAFLILPLLVPHPLRAIITTFKASLWAAGFCAFKFVPVVFWLREFPDRAYAGSQFTLPFLVDIFLGRHLHGAQVIPYQSAGWHEYGAYIGYFALVLAFLGASLAVKNRIARSLLIASLMALLLSSAGPALEPLFDASPWLPRSMIARVIYFAVLPLALLAGFGLDLVRRKLRGGRILALVLIGLVAVDLMSLTYQLSAQPFVIPPVTNPRAAAPAPIAFTGKVSTYTVPEKETYTRAYESTLAGYGTLNYCSVLGPPTNINIVEGEVDPSFVTADPAQASVNLTSWSPNHFTVDIIAHEPAEIRVNTNYATGWYANKQLAREIGNRVGLRVEPGTYTIVFNYHTKGLGIGLLITMTTLLTAVVYLYAMRQPSPDNAPTAQA